MDEVRHGVRGRPVKDRLAPVRHLPGGSVPLVIPVEARPARADADLLHAPELALDDGRFEFAHPNRADHLKADSNPLAGVRRPHRLPLLDEGNRRLFQVDENVALQAIQRHLEVERDRRGDDDHVQRGFPGQHLAVVQVAAHPGGFERGPQFGHNAQHRVYGGEQLGPPVLLQLADGRKVVAADAGRPN